MANSVANLKDRIHRATCGELEALLIEVQETVAAYPELTHYALNHWLREYNRRSLNNCEGAGLITPHDGGLRPYAVPELAPLAVPTDIVLALENDDWFALESGDLIGLQ